MRAVDATNASGQAAPGVEAQALVAAGELDAAIARLRSEADRPGDHSKYLAWLEQRRGDYVASEGTLAALVASEPLDVEARLSLAFAQWHRGDLAGAQTTIARIPTDDPAADAAWVALARDNGERLRTEVAAMQRLAAEQGRLDAMFLGVLTLSVVISVAAMVVVARRPAS